MGESSVAAAQFPEDRALLARFACAASRLTAPAERSRPMWVAIPFATGSDDPFSEPDAGLRAPACLAFDKGAETVAKLGAERGHADAIAIELRGICRFLQFDDEEIRPGSTAAMDDHIGHDSGVTLAVAPPRAVIRKRYGLDDAIDMVLLSDCGIAFLLRASHPRQFATRGSTLIVQRRSKSGQSPAPRVPGERPWFMATACFQRALRLHGVPQHCAVPGLHSGPLARSHGASLRSRPQAISRNLAKVGARVARTPSRRSRARR